MVNLFLENVVLFMKFTPKVKHLVWLKSPILIWVPVWCDQFAYYLAQWSGVMSLTPVVRRSEYESRSDHFQGMGLSTESFSFSVDVESTTFGSDEVDFILSKALKLASNSFVCRYWQRRPLSSSCRQGIMIKHQILAGLYIKYRQLP